MAVGGDAKKAARPSPSDSAAATPVGTRKRGNDGRMWVVATDRRGVHRWVPAAGQTAPKAAIKKASRSTRSTRAHRIRIGNPGRVDGASAAPPSSRFRFAFELPITVLDHLHEREWAPDPQVRHVMLPTPVPSGLRDTLRRRIMSLSLIHI